MANLANPADERCVYLSVNVHHLAGEQHAVHLPMAEETIFSKIIRRDIDADILHQDDLVTAFRDISPQAPTHILIVPNQLIPTVNDVSAEDEAALGRLFTVAAKLAKEAGIDQDGYRLLVNCNQHGGQEVYHLHMHLMGGEPLGPMRCK